MKTVKYPDGTVEVVSPTSRTVTQPDKTVIVEYLQARDDGCTKKTTFPDKVVVSTFEDGRSVQRNPVSGIVITTRPDGSRRQTHPDGASVETRPDGSRIQVDADGTGLVERTDGVRIQLNPDRSSVISLPAPAAKKLHVFADGCHILEAADGSSVQHNPDRTVVQIKPNGDKVSTLSCGTMIAEFLSGEGPVERCEVRPTGEVLEVFRDGKEQRKLAGSAGARRPGPAPSANPSASAVLAVVVRCCNERRPPAEIAEELDDIVNDLRKQLEAEAEAEAGEEKATDEAVARALGGPVEAQRGDGSPGNGKENPKPRPPPPAGSRRTTFKCGTEVVLSPDGVRTTTKPDGTVIEDFGVSPSADDATPPRPPGPDGIIKRTTFPDGVVVEGFADGRTEQSNPSLPEAQRIIITCFPDGRKEQRHADGSSLVLHPAGHRTQKHADGTVITTHADGRREQQNPDGSEIVVRVNGTKVHSFPDGCIIESMEDGSTLQTEPDGTTIETRPNGDRITRFAGTGAVTEEFASGKLKRRDTLKDGSVHEISR
jgi:hypothetical protein